MRLFDIELEELNRKLLDMGELVETAIRGSVRALVDQNRDLAEQVIRDHELVMRLEGEIEGMATRLLALRQPVARDLRLLTVALKINGDLERIGKLSSHVAGRALLLLGHPLVEPLKGIPRMGSLVESMLRQCLEAFVKGDAGLARSVLLADDEVDALRDALYTDLQALMQKNTAAIPAAVDLIFVARNLERIGDHATNIAEDVVFLVQGVDVRHHADSR